MLDVCLLGRGGMYPLPNRYLTALMVRYNGGFVLVDCGEATQMAIREAGWGFKQINTICITHFHGDHISGLPGLLMTIGNAGREEPLHMVGPAGLRHVVESLCVIAPYLPFPLTFTELKDPTASLELAPQFTLEAARVEHSVACYGYSLTLARSGKFLVEQAQALGIPREQWSYLQKGQSIEQNGTIITPEQVLSAPRKGLKVTYTTDLRPGKAAVALAKGADLFLCDANYGDPEKAEKAIEHKHCMFTETAGMAKEAGVRELWLTHFSPSMMNPEEFLPLAQAVFPASFIDRSYTELRFEE